MNAAIKIKTSQKTLDSLWDEYKSEFGRSAPIEAAIAAISHRKNSIKKHVTATECKQCLEYAMYGIMADGSVGEWKGLDRMIDVTQCVYRKSEGAERGRYLRKLSLLRDIADCLDLEKERM